MFVYLQKDSPFSFFSFFGRTYLGVFPALQIPRCISPFSTFQPVIKRSYFRLEEIGFPTIHSCIIFTLLTVNVLFNSLHNSPYILGIWVGCVWFL